MPPLDLVTGQQSEIAGLPMFLPEKVMARPLRATAPGVSLQCGAITFAYRTGGFDQRMQSGCSIFKLADAVWPRSAQSAVVGPT